jgi:hypothetical protein
MARHVIYAVADLVEIEHDDELDAVWLRWLSEYDEGTAVRDAVMFAIGFVRANNIRHWVGDLSVSRQGLSAADQAWVGGAFRKEIAATPLAKLVLVPPGPETGQDTGWLGEWEANAKAEFGSRVDARVLGDRAAIVSFFRE